MFVHRVIEWMDGSILSAAGHGATVGVPARSRELKAGRALSGDVRAVRRQLLDC
ncbi:hypothetical protein GX408_18530 [bacterium]|nr:hypothetical protein [bacterium]